MGLAESAAAVYAAVAGVILFGLAARLPGDRRSSARERFADLATMVVAALVWPVFIVLMVLTPGSRERGPRGGDGDRGDGSSLPP